MQTRFDELAKEMAQSVTRRGALKRFGAGLGIALAMLGLVDRAEAAKGGCFPLLHHCTHNLQCCSGRCLFSAEGGGKGYCFIP